METLTMYLLAIIFLIIALVYRYFSHAHSYWQKRGIPIAKNGRPIIGHVPIIITFRNILDVAVDIYKKHPGLSMVGFYDYKTPCLLIRDPELVKKVLNTNFADFADNDSVVQEDEEPLLSKNPFFTNGKAWKTGRTRLTASLTGNKLKTYSKMMYDITEKLINYVDQRVQKTGNFEVEAKGLFTRVTAETGAIVGFGIEGHCFDDSKGDDTFVAVGRMFFSTDIKMVIKLMLLMQFPWMLGLFKATLISKEFEQFFEQLVRRNLDSRKATGVNGQNVIDAVTDLEEKEGDPSTRFRDISSHMLSFFLDLFETASATMTFLAYNLSINKDIQNKVRNEVTKVLDKHKELNYEALNEMVYLEQAMSESLRHIPALSAFIKRCTQRIELEGSDGLKCVVEPGTRIFIPVGGLNSDTQYFDEPHLFKPERFDSENVQSRNKFAHLPFGEGPRMCPGKKFSLVLIKMTFAKMLMKFEFNLSKKTKLPLTFATFPIAPIVNGGMWLNITKLK